MFCADSIEQYGRRDNIGTFGFQEIIDEVVYARVVYVAEDIRVTTSKQDTSVNHPLLFKNPRSRPISPKIVRRETKFRVMTHISNLKISSGQIYFNVKLKLLRANYARALCQRPDVNNVIIFNEEID